MGTLFNDIKYALRQLIKSPGFTAVAALTIGLGIGAATALFGAFKALVLDPFPYPQSDRIAHVWTSVSRDGETPLSAPDFLDIRQQNASFSEMGAYTLGRVNLGRDIPESLCVVRCTVGVLRTFGVKPALGRWLGEADEHPGAAPVVVISHSLWRRVFECDPHVLGQTLRLDGQETPVVGVMPADFEFHTPRHRGRDFEIWMPLVLDDSNRDRHWLLSVGRLKPGITFEAARADIQAIGFHMRSHRDEITRFMASTTWYLFGAVTLLLSVACANIAGMLLARGTRRQGEFGIRLALGSTRCDVVRLVLCESVLIALLGSCVGVVLGGWGLSAMRHLVPPLLVNPARRAALRADSLVLGFSIGLACLTALLFGLLPALTAARTSVIATLKESGRSQLGSQIHHRFLRHLVVGQIALAVVLASSAVLLSTSYLNVLDANEVLDSDHVLTSEIALRGRRYDDRHARQQFWDRLIGRVGLLPGVEHVATATNLPLEGDFSSSILAEGEVFDHDTNRPLAEFSTVSPDYFAAMGISIVRGRAPVPMDAGGEIVGVAVNQALVQRCWPAQDPMGKLIQANSPNPWFRARVVGVVADVRQWGAEHPALPEVYFPCANSDRRSGTLIVRTSAGARGFIPLLRQELAGLDRDLPLANIRTMRQVVAATTSGRRLYTLLIDVFTGAAIALTVVGIYGTLSYNLLQQRREMGIRIALGALRHHIFHLVVRQAGTWLVAGLLIGLALTAILSLLLRSLVYNISPRSPLSLLLGLCIVSGAACLACVLPARRAVKTGPMEALRHE